MERIYVLKDILMRYTSVSKPNLSDIQIRHPGMWFRRGREKKQREEEGKKNTEFITICLGTVQQIAPISQQQP